VRMPGGIAFFITGLNPFRCSLCCHRFTNR
jgi:hypothetical protein